MFRPTLKSPLASSMSRALRSNWKGLSSFVNESVSTAWNEIKSCDGALQNVIDNNRSGTVTKIDWSQWKERIGNPKLLEAFESNYNCLISLLDKIPQPILKYCEVLKRAEEESGKSAEEAMRLIEDGVKALWISNHNPPVWKIDPNEWLESDQYWQAYIEKHAVFAPHIDSLDPESPAEIEARRQKWQTNVAKFNERTDTPILYDYMNHLPTWEYYDINRKQFYQHMSYFLNLTGEDFRHFPDIPKWQWITHCEDLNFKLFAVQHRRKVEKQLTTKSRHVSNDLEPEEGHCEETHEMAFLSSEKERSEEALIYLLSNYAFLSDPYIPFENLFQLELIKSRFGDGKLFSFGEDVDVLFFLPNKALSTVSPKKCFHLYLVSLVIT